MNMLNLSSLGCHADVDGGQHKVTQRHLPCWSASDRVTSDISSHSYELNCVPGITVFIQKVLPIHASYNLSPLDLHIDRTDSGWHRIDLECNGLLGGSQAKQRSARLPVIKVDEREGREGREGEGFYRFCPSFSTYTITGAQSIRSASVRSLGSSPTLTPCS